MNNLEFFMLQHEIKDAMEELIELQAQYRKLTGVKFIDGQVIKDPAFCNTCRFLSVLGLCCCEDSEFFKNLNPVYGCGEHEEEEG